MPARDTPTPPRSIKVTVNDEPKRECASNSCRLRADLLVSIHPNPSGRNSPGYCVDHWAQIRSLFLGRNYQIQYGERAPQLIINQTPVKGVITRLRGCGLR